MRPARLSLQHPSRSSRRECMHAVPRRASDRASLEIASPPCWPPWPPNRNSRTRGEFVHEATPLRGRVDTPRCDLAREAARKDSDCTTPSFGGAARTHAGHRLCIISVCTVRCSACCLCFVTDCTCLSFHMGSESANTDDRSDRDVLERAASPREWRPLSNLVKSPPHARP